VTLCSKSKDSLLALAAAHGRLNVLRYMMDSALQVDFQVRNLYHVIHNSMSTIRLSCPSLSYSLSSCYAYFQPCPPYLNPPSSHAQQAAQRREVFTAISVAASRGRLNPVILLRQYWTGPAPDHSLANSPLHLSCLSGCEDLVRHLVEAREGGSVEETPYSPPRSVILTMLLSE
jgi:hypothetical protein